MIDAVEVSYSDSSRLVGSRSVSFGANVKDPPNWKNRHHVSNSIGPAIRLSVHLLSTVSDPIPGSDFICDCVLCF